MLEGISGHSAAIALDGYGHGVEVLFQARNGNTAPVLNGGKSIVTNPEGHWLKLPTVRSNSRKILSQIEGNHNIALQGLLLWESGSFFQYLIDVKNFDFHFHASSPARQGNAP